MSIHAMKEIEDKYCIEQVIHEGFQSDEIMWFTVKDRAGEVQVNMVGIVAEDHYRDGTLLEIGTFVDDCGEMIFEPARYLGLRMCLELLDASGLEELM